MDIDLSRPFLTRQFERAGHTRWELQNKAYHQLVRGVWVLEEHVDLDCMYRAALLLHPPWAFVSRLSAAALLGLPVPDHPFVHITVRQEKERRFRPQIKIHVTSRRRRIIVVRGMRVSDPFETFIDCAGSLGFVDLVILGDALCRKFKLTASDLRKACAETEAYYAGLARAAASFVRDGVDSPMETRLRLLIVLAGLPEPEVNVVRRWEDGSWRRRYDLCYERIKLIVEYDGRQHATDRSQWRADIARREEFDDEGYRVIVVTAEGIFENPLNTLRRVRRQLVLRGWGAVPMISDDWRAHFAA
ncbi:DUF559 domain-containing protein [Nocardioides sp. QY071]|uniref:DUF559 domain-containing protein n=1 Tax=Nocardioides sp. QY071 TaxID=3044187 RepID=UPI00249C0534|nr:DUF559 domain-containing protein [Nocardioides sp. QY071]WGY02545.1 DUF559 domain-containing protein [Nocardioides sp. QY071]